MRDTSTEEPKHMSIGIFDPVLVGTELLGFDQPHAVGCEMLPHGDVVGHEHRQPGSRLSLSLLREIDLLAVPPDDREVGGFTERVVKLQPDNPGIKIDAVTQAGHVENGVDVVDLPAGKAHRVVILSTGKRDSFAQQIAVVQR